MGILNWFKIVKNKKIHEAILEIAVNTHSPFCPKLVDYSACVPPALQNGFVNSFDFDNFESHKHSYTQFWSQTLLDFFSLWVTLATLGDPLSSLKYYPQKLWDERYIRLLQQVMPFPHGFWEGVYRSHAKLMLPKTLSFGSHSYYATTELMFLRDHHAVRHLFFASLLNIPERIWPQFLPQIIEWPLK